MQNNFILMQKIKDNENQFTNKTLNIQHQTEHKT